MVQGMTWNERLLGPTEQAENNWVVDDSSLIARARAGDPAAFERLYEQYHAPILNYLHRMVGDRTLAEDLTQDTFEKAYRGLANTKPDLAFKAWLYRIATNTAFSNGRRQKIVKWIPFAPVFDRATNENVENTVGNRQDVQNALSKIPDHYAAALLLRHYQGLSLKETAVVLDVTEAACKLRLFRARKAFASAYGGPDAGDPEITRAMENTV
jgi:RNA polymerase sigma-70 factor, ECF subfamily